MGTETTNSNLLPHVNSVTHPLSTWFVLNDFLFTFNKEALLYQGTEKYICILRHISLRFVIFSLHLTNKEIITAFPHLL
jgi:hypothetical protein